MPRAARRGAKELKATTTGLTLVDALSVNATPTIDDYVGAVSEYVINVRTLPEGGPKQAQIALGNGLGRVLAAELAAKVPRMNLHPGELKVAGALRDTRADVSEAHELDGLRVAVELKPVNLAVGRALWNRFGDIRAFAVNIHLKFPFAVVGGVLAIPTWEEAKITKKMAAERSAAEAAMRERVADQLGDDAESGDADEDEDLREEEEAEALQAAAGDEVYQKSTLDLIHRLIQRLDKTRLRDTEADPAHLLEAVTVIVYDPGIPGLHPDLPDPDSKLRWGNFVSRMAEIYDARFD
jgi:hypothetical protein